MLRNEIHSIIPYMVQYPYLRISCRHKGILPYPEEETASLSYANEITAFEKQPLREVIENNKEYVDEVFSLTTENTENINTTGSGRKYVASNGLIKDSTENYIGMMDVIPCEANEEYTVSFFGQDTSVNRYQIHIAYYDANMLFISRYSSGNKNGAEIISATDSTPENTAYIFADMYNASSVADSVKIMVAKGSTNPTKYVNPLTAVDVIARDKVNALDDIVNANYPSYFDENIATAISNIRRNMGVVGVNGDSFVFITDPHMGYNQGHSPNLIKHIIKNTGIRNVVCGGDALDSGSKESEMAKAYAFEEAYNFVDGGLKFVVGNHDGNVNQHGADNSYWLTGEELYSIFYSKAEMEWHDIHITEGLSNNHII